MQAVLIALLVGCVVAAGIAKHFRTVCTICVNFWCCLALAFWYDGTDGAIFLLGPCLVAANLSGLITFWLIAATQE